MKIITTNLLNRFWKNGVKPIKDAASMKLDKSKVVNNLLTTEGGFVLDARQGAEIHTRLEQLDSLLNAVSSSGIADSILQNHSIGRTMSVDELLNRREVTFFTNWEDTSFFPGTFGSGVLIPALDGNIKFIIYMTGHSLFYHNYNNAIPEHDSGWILVTGVEKYTAP